MFGEGHLLRDWDDWDVTDDDVVDDADWMVDEDQEVLPPRDDVVIDDGEGRDYDKETNDDDDDKYFYYED